MNANLIGDTQPNNLVNNTSGQRIGEIQNIESNNVSPSVDTTQNLQNVVLGEDPTFADIVLGAGFGPFGRKLKDVAVEGFNQMVPNQTTQDPTTQKGLTGQNLEEALKTVQSEDPTLTNQQRTFGDVIKDIGLAASTAKVDSMFYDGEKFIGVDKDNKKIDDLTAEQINFIQKKQYDPEKTIVSSNEPGVAPDGSRLIPTQNISEVLLGKNPEIQYVNKAGLDAVTNKLIGGVPAALVLSETRNLEGDRFGIGKAFEYGGDLYRIAPNADGTVSDENVIKVDDVEMKSRFPDEFKKLRDPVVQAIRNQDVDLSKFVPPGVNVTEENRESIQEALIKNREKNIAAKELEGAIAEEKQFDANTDINNLVKNLFPNASKDQQLIYADQILKLLNDLNQKDKAAPATEETQATQNIVPKIGTSQANRIIEAASNLPNVKQLLDSNAISREELIEQLIQDNKISR